MAYLHLSMTPARPKELGGLVSGQPSVARKTFGWQNNPDNASMKTLGCVVVDGRSQVLKVTPCTAMTSPNPHILATSLAGHVGERPDHPIEAIRCEWSAAFAHEHKRRFRCFPLELPQRPELIAANGMSARLPALYPVDMKCCGQKQKLRETDC